VGSVLECPDGIFPIVHLDRRPQSNWIVVVSDGKELARVTPDHRFYKANGQEIRARDVRLGDLLASAGDHIQVTGLTLDQTEASLVSLELPPPHMYYVGESKLLSHNVKP
jgi:hypothetical protein